MKKVLFAVIALMITSASFAQIQVRSTNKTKIGEAKNFTAFIAELSYTVGTDTLYTLTYNNAKYKRITDYESITFTNAGGTVDQLYEILMSVFKDENKKNKDYQVNFKLGDTEVRVATERNFGVTSAMLITPTGYFYLTEKQIKKLFNKN